MSQLRRNLIRSYRVLTQPWRWQHWRRAKRNKCFPISILFYHRVADRHPTPWTMGNDCFQEQIDWLTRNFEMIGLREAQVRIESGVSPRPACCITFDDGYADNHDLALPYLMRRQIPVTYFVSYDHIRHNLPFTHDQERGLDLARDSFQSIRHLSQCGIEIGCHTRTHPDFGEKLSDERVRDEVVDATRELEAVIGRRVRHFAIPFGQLNQMDERVFQQANSIGLEGVCSAFGGTNFIGSNPFHLRRIHGDPNLERMKNWLTGDPRVLMKSDPIADMVNRVTRNGKSEECDRQPDPCDEQPEGQQRLGHSGVRVE